MIDPLVSVIVPVYNGSRFLRQAVESACRQTYRSVEVLIIDDCSTDDSLELARELAAADKRIRILSNRHNIGVAESRNRGIDEALGGYIAFLDADDLWAEGKLRVQIDAMEARRLDVCYAAYSFVGETGESMRRPYGVPEELGRERLLRENVIGCSTAVIRRDCLGETRMRREYAHEDYVFWLELIGRGLVFGGINSVLMRYRVSDQNRSGDKAKAARNRWLVYRDFLGMGRIRAAYWFSLYAVNGAIKHRG